MIDSLSTLDIHLPSELGGKLSFSSIDKFMSCPECWSRKYLLHEPHRTHVSLPKGSAVHKVLEVARYAAINGEDFSNEQAADTVRDAYLGFVSEIEDLDLGTEKTGYVKAEDAVDDLQLLTKGFMQIVAEERKAGILAVEPRVDFESLNWPFAFDGYVDVIVRGPQRPILKDNKTANKKSALDYTVYVQNYLYRLPFFRAGKVMDGQIDRCYVKFDSSLRTRRPVVEKFPVAAHTASFDAAERWVLLAAAQMSTGLYPARPGWKCDYPHEFSAEEAA